MANRSKQKTLYCSFCGKAAAQVSCMVAGPHVFICDECIICVAHLPLRSRLGALATMVLPWRWRYRMVRLQAGDQSKTTTLPSAKSTDSTILLFIGALLDGLD